MYAVIEAGGEQIKVAPGDVLKIQKLSGENGTEIGFENVLLVVEDDKIVVGSPYIDQARIKAEVQGNARSSKIEVFKQKPRKGYRKLRGHRQDYSIVRIKDIVVGG